MRDYMNFNDFLPVGSVVMLNNAIKKLVIIGIMQVKPSDDGTAVTYDYVGVPYPEGYMGPETGLLFQHDDIHEVISTGYTDNERALFLDVMQTIVDKGRETIGK